MSCLSTAHCASFPVRMYGLEFGGELEAKVVLRALNANDRLVGGVMFRGARSSTFAQRTHRNLPYGELRLTHRVLLLRRAIPQSIITPYLCCSPKI